MKSETPIQVDMEPEWRAALSQEFSKPYFHQLRAQLYQARSEGRTIYPPGPRIFHAFEATPLSQVRVVILGQDPYHGPGQAMGLSFSVPHGIPQPPSLKNILKEVAADVGAPTPRHGNLSPWATQGVFLLNAMLTVEAHQASSHRDLGWQYFTDAVIRLISDRRENVAFLLWGSFAQRKQELIDGAKHLILKAPHPSPLSAHRGFLGCRHFSRTNAWLVDHGQEPIDWNLPD